MTTATNGGPAFPLQTWDTAIQSPKTETGMTLRDYFAIRAFQTRLSKYNDWTLTELTEQAYQDADAMMKARES